MNICKNSATTIVIKINNGKQLLFFARNGHICFAQRWQRDRFHFAWNGRTCFARRGPPHIARRGQALQVFCRPSQYLDGHSDISLRIMRMSCVDSHSFCEPRQLLPANPVICFIANDDFFYLSSSLPPKTCKRRQQLHSAPYASTRNALNLVLFAHSVEKLDIKLRIPANPMLAFQRFGVSADTLPQKWDCQ